MRRIIFMLETGDEDSALRVYVGKLDAKLATDNGSWTKWLFMPAPVLTSTDLPDEQLAGSALSAIVAWWNAEYACEGKAREHCTITHEGITDETTGVAPAKW